MGNILQSRWRWTEEKIRQTSNNGSWLISKKNLPFATTLIRKFSFSSWFNSLSIQNASGTQSTCFKIMASLHDQHTFQKAHWILHAQCLTHNRLVKALQQVSTLTGNLRKPTFIYDAFHLSNSGRLHSPLFLLPRTNYHTDVLVKTLLDFNIQVIYWLLN